MQGVGGGLCPSPLKMGRGFCPNPSYLKGGAYILHLKKSGGGGFYQGGRAYDCKNIEETLVMNFRGCCKV